jgi:diguanylate cyclase (GGDEF)-like protein
VKPPETIIAIALSPAVPVRVIETNADLDGVAEDVFRFDGRPAALVLAFVSADAGFDVAAVARACAPAPFLALPADGELCATQGEAWHCDGGGRVVLQIFSPRLVAAASLHLIPLQGGASRRRAPALSREPRIARFVDALNDIALPFALDARDSLALTFIDGASGCESLFMEAVYRSGRFPCLFIGGLSAARHEPAHGHAAGARIAGHAALIFLKLAPGMHYGAFKSHPFHKTDIAFPVLEVDPARRCVLTLIDPAGGEIVPALNALARALDCAPDALEARLSGHGFGIEIDGELQVRALAHMDAEQGALTFHGDINPGDTLFLLRAGDGVRQAEGDLALFLHDKPPPVAGLLFDCARWPDDGGQRHAELGRGWPVPVAGLASGGEILGLALNQTLIGVFFFAAAGRAFHDATVDAFALLYARFSGHFIHCRLRRAEILNGLRGGLMRLLLDDAQLALAGEDTAGGGRRAGLAAIRLALRAGAWEGDEASDIEAMMRYRRRYEENLWRQANFDDLTGLPNRVLMLDRLGQAIAQAQRARVCCALLYLDLDRFKHVNDSQGHAAGDSLLRELAQRLRKCLREGDTLARLGGDEFVIILPDLPRPYQAAKVAEHVTRIVSRPFEINGVGQTVTASVGIALFPGDGQDSQTLLRNADLAMYKAKEAGRNGYRFFTQALNSKLLRRSALEARLRGALERGEMRLHYQAIVDLDSGEVVAQEGLLRWQDGAGTLRLPREFVPLAEEAGLAASLGDWVLERACADARTVFARRGGVPHIALNVSPRQLQAPAFADRVATLLATAGLAPHALELEITESVLLDERQETVCNLGRLCELGVGLAIDDFGLGNASLAHLQRYRLTSLKMDGSLIQHMLEREQTGRLIEAMIAMGHAMGWRMIAEGVETAAQCDFLRALRCDLAQGYWFGRPAPLPEPDA